MGRMSWRVDRCWKTTMVLVFQGGGRRCYSIGGLAVLGVVKRGLTPYYIIRGVGLGLCWARGVCGLGSIRFGLDWIFGL